MREIVLQTMPEGAGNPSARQWWRSALTPAAILPAGLILMSILAFLLPGGQEALQFDRQAIEAGQWWRVVTCHLAHWKWVHLASDMTTFTVLWFLMGCRLPQRAAFVAVAAVIIGAATFALSDFAFYRGMSGVDYAMLGWVLVTLAAATDRRGKRICLLAALAAMAVKVTLELFGCHFVPDMNLPGGVAVVGVVHASGLATGAIAACLRIAKRSAAEAARAFC